MIGVSVYASNSSRTKPGNDYKMLVLNPAVGSVGDSYDNALAETINGLYNTDVIRQQGPWRHIEAVEFATLSWVDWFNNRRLFEPIGNVPPREKEIEYYQKLQGSALAA